MEDLPGNRSHHNLETHGPDSTVVVDEKEARVSGILFRENQYEDQGLAAPGTTTSGTIVDGHEYGNDHTSECFRSPTIGSDVHVDLYFSLSEENTCDTGKEEGEPVEASGSTCYCHCGDYRLLTSTTSRDLGCPYPRRYRKEGYRWIRSPQSCPRDYLCRSY